MELENFSISATEVLSAPFEGSTDYRKRHFYAICQGFSGNDVGIEMILYDIIISATDALTAPVKVSLSIIGAQLV